MTQPREARALDEPTLGELVATASRDMSLLVHQEVELAKLELKQSAISGALGGAFFGVAGAFGFFALLAITIAMAEAITYAGIERFWSYLIVAGFYLLMAAFLAAFGASRMRRLRPPERTMRTVKDNIAWLKRPTVASVTGNEASRGH